MNIFYKNPGFEHSIDSIMLFQTEEQTPYWSDSLLYFYPQVDSQTLAKLSFAARKDYIAETLYHVYHREIKQEMDEKVDAYNRHFTKHKEQIEDALSEAFALDTRKIFNDVTGNLTMNPVCPRFLKERCFDVFYKNSERGAIGMSLHEMIHYLWFFVWNRHFGDDYGEYENPSMKWILSEMVVESIMSDERLSSINPYYPRENGGCVYSYFQNMIIDGKPILETLDKYYRELTIRDFMERSYQYCLTFEKDIRSHITEAENKTDL
ncbi:MAG: hypothetical protein IKU58_05525 [Clostridia bacterium]|nr:hypothetical protein [Clostridia bacterium]